MAKSSLINKTYYVTQESNNDNDNYFLTKWNESDNKIFTYEEMRWENNKDEWGDLECL